MQHCPRAVQGGALKAIVVGAIVGLAGCGGGGGGGGDDTTATTSLSGTAATGAAINGTVTVTNSAGVESGPETIAQADGSFIVEVEKNPPYILKAESTDGQTVHYSYAAEGQTVANITPFSSLALLKLVEDDGKTLEELYAGWQSSASAITSADITTSVQAINQSLQAEFQAQGVSSTDFNFFTDGFKPDQTGFDAVLDNVTVAINGTTATVTTANGSEVVINVNVGEGSTAINIPEGSTWSLSASVVVSGQTINIDSSQFPQNLVQQPPVSQSDLDQVFTSTNLSFDTDQGTAEFNVDVSTEGDLSSVGDKLIWTVTGEVAFQGSPSVPTTTVYTWTRQS